MVRKKKKAGDNERTKRRDVMGQKITTAFFFYLAFCLPNKKNSVDDLRDVKERMDQKE